MSRIGKLPVEIPAGVTVTQTGQTLAVKGPKGELSITLVDAVKASIGEDGVSLKPKDDSKRSRAMWGMQRSLVANLVEGVSKGFERNLELEGVGYRAQMQGNDLKLSLGFSHDVIYTPPKGVKIVTPKPTEIVLSGPDKQQLGQVAADIRRFRSPEPYKGKGVRYAGEYIRRKEGKKK
ncbi:MAG: 50S ribosomal protein L6 [Maricaulaceae bacterium]|nr:50S ribosomal protein L6 [Maricaulaceae bacterium]